jgi:UDP-N-acetylglucosamine 2-epimerase (non-hydrolysing)
MIKVLTVFGTRPEAIKMAPVIRELARYPEHFTSVVCVTSQHRQMLDQVLGLFDIRPRIDLNIMQPGQSLTDITTAVLRGMECVLAAEQPDWVLVQGDTTTVLSTALAAYYQRARIGHVEAGLRTHDKYQPFPEEINRRVVSTVTDLHFAPTAWAADNLRAEGTPEERIVVTGNTVIDALQHVLSLPFDPAAGPTPLDTLPVGRKRIILVTAHRRENFGHGLQEICAALREIAATWDDVHLVYPVHLNPNVQEPVYSTLSDVPNITLLPPLEYQPLAWLLQQASLVITDSGGLQEEAPGLGKPVLVLRERTERPEGIATGLVHLVGTDRRRIVATAARELDCDQTTAPPRVSPYGDGHAAERIVASLTL